MSSHWTVTSFPHQDGIGVHLTMPMRSSLAPLTALIYQIGVEVPLMNYLPVSQISIREFI